ncbi:MAG: putative PLP-dependent enzyme [Acidimicrobiales bacterium]|nr:putative PLP-dependent enzyme [Acidimicrobiales bacterium]
MDSRAWQVGSTDPHAHDAEALMVQVPVRRRTPSPRSSQPAILGGPQAFPTPLPFCRPTRPPLAEVMARYSPSYEQGVVTNGPLVAELEERVAERLGVRRVVAVSSCTSGLTLAVQAVTDGAAGHVVMPSFTFLASGHAVRWNGLQPRFVECDAATFQMDLAHAAQHLDGASAILATHVFGAPCDPAGVEALAASAGIPVVFDAAHAFGATTAGRPVGGSGSVEVFSLTPTKLLVAGEGGLVATDDEELAERVRVGRNYGDPGTYDAEFVGLNARMSELHAAMALVGLERFDQVLARRLTLAEHYARLLEGIPGVALQAVDPADRSTTKDLTIAVDPERFGLTRDQLVLALRAEGIDTRSYFDPPMHRQRAYASFHQGALPVTDATSSRVVSLPIYNDLTGADVERVADAVQRVHQHASAVDDRLVQLRGSA